MMTLYSVIGTIEGDVDLYGKTAKELGAYKLAKSGAVTGKGLYVSGYTGFNGAEAYMQVVGSKNPPVKMDKENVIYLGKTAATAKKKQVEITHGEDRWILSFEGCAFKKA